jgi:hypothetical protein
MLLSVSGHLQHSTLGLQTWCIEMKYTTVIRDTVCFYYSLSELVFFIFILLGCWILPQYQAERIVTEYLWVWLSGLFMIILYGIMFAIIRRWIKIAHSIHWYDQPHRGALDMESDDDKKLKAVANSMLLLVHFSIIEG